MSKEGGVNGQTLRASFLAVSVRALRPPLLKSVGRKRRVRFAYTQADRTVSEPPALPSSGQRRRRTDQ